MPSKLSLTERWRTRAINKGDVGWVSFAAVFTAERSAVLDEIGESSAVSLRRLVGRLDYGRNYRACLDDDEVEQVTPDRIDEELLSRYRQAYPYMSLVLAKELHRTEKKFGHLGRTKVQREQQAHQQEQARQEVTKGPMRAQDRD